MRDVIIVGAGGGGAVVAKELAAQGLDVLLLEGGPRNARPETDWTHFEIDQSDAVQGNFRCGPSDRSRSPWTREIVGPGVIWQVAGVGGTTLHYFANCPRSMPGIFNGYAGADAAAYDRVHEFPFTYRELLPYFEWVEDTLPVQTAAMGRKEELFLHAAESTGLPLQRSRTTTADSFRPQENAILQPQGTAGKTGDARKLRYPQAKGCTFCGYCLQGCIEPLGAPRNLKAKRSTDASYIPMALTAPAWSRGGKAITLIADAFVISIDTHVVSGELRPRGVTWRETTTGTVYSEDARVVVLAGGAIETPRLWMNSGLPDPNGWVGRGLTDHAYDVAVGVFPFDTGFGVGPSSGARADFPGRGSIEQIGAPPASAAFAAAMSDSGMAGLYDNGAPVPPAGADLVGRAAGPLLKQVAGSFGRLMAVICITDDDVEYQNYIGLSTNFPPDEHGPMPLMDIRNRSRTARTSANREFLVGKAIEIIRAAGASFVLRMNWPPMTAHLHSSMRMGADPSNSVTDPNGEARAVRRLFIADNSMLSNSVGGMNPTLTMQAIATRTAEKIVERCFGGRAWVKTGSPVSSIDPAVTHAVVRAGM
jgi:choline dehydrogenase-like flavoprotein